jgi:hypothetical protein
VDVLAGLEAVVFLAGHDTECVGTEVITLSLEEVGRHDLTTVAVEEGKRSAKGRGRDTPENGLSDDATPAGLCLVDGLVEEVVEQKRLELGGLGVGCRNITKEDGLDDATTTPHAGNTSVVQVPLEVLSSLTHEHEALGVRHDLGSVECLLEIIDELLFVTLERLLGRASDDLTCTNTLLLDGRQATSEHGLTNERDGHAGIESVDGSPLAGSLLASLIEDLLDERDAIVILELKDIGGDVDEERVEDALVPLEEDVSDLILGDPKTTLENVIRLSDELHVTVFDTIVDHLHVVACTSLADPIAAGLAVDLSRGSLEDLLDRWPCCSGTARHDRGAVTGTLLSTRDTRADEEETLGLELFGTTDGVRVVRVTTIYYDVALLEERDELGNKVIDSRAGLHEEHDFAGSLELGAELFN